MQVCKKQRCGWATRCWGVLLGGAEMQSAESHAAEQGSASFLPVGEPRENRAASTTISTIQAGPQPFLLLFSQVAETPFSSQMLPLIFNHRLHSHFPRAALLPPQPCIARMQLREADTNLPPHQCIQTRLLDPSSPCATITTWRSHNEW